MCLLLLHYILQLLVIWNGALRTVSDGHAGVPGVKPVVIELTDVKTKEKVDEIEVDACLVATGRAPYTHVSLLATLCIV